MDDELIREGKRLRVNLQANEGPDDQSTLYTFALWAVDCAERLASRLEERGREGAWRPTHRHVKRGMLYRLVSSAVLQTEHPIGDNEFLALYQGDDGLYWVRPADEFKDGRFEELPPAPPEGASE